MVAERQPGPQPEHAPAADEGGSPDPGRAETVARLFEMVLALQGDPRGLERTAQVIAEEARARLPGCEPVISIVPWNRPAEFQVIAGAGPWAETLVGRSWPIEGTVHEAALASTSPIEIVSPADRARFPEVFAEGQIRSGRLLPLVSGAPLPGQRMARGVIGFWSQRREPFSDRDRVLTDNLGRLATLLLLQVEAWHAAERSEGRLRLRMAIAEDVQSSLDTVDIVDRTIGHLLEIADADRVTLSTIEGDELVILFSRDRTEDPRWPEGRFPLTRALSNEAVAAVLASRRPQRGGAFRVAESSPFNLELGRALHTALVPLVIRNEVTGLIVLTRRSGEAFSDDEMAELEIGASVAALALRNARLFQQGHSVARARSVFLNDAADELRTPFGVISGYLSLLAEGAFGPTPPEMARPLSIVTEKTAELGRLIDQILAASGAESDDHELRVVEAQGRAGGIHGARRRPAGRTANRGMPPKAGDPGAEPTGSSRAGHPEAAP